MADFKAKDEWEAIPTDKYLLLFMPDFMVVTQGLGGTYIKNSPNKAKQPLSDFRFRNIQYDFAGPVVGPNSIGNEFKYRDDDTLPSVNILKKNPTVQAKIQKLQYDCFSEAYETARKKYSIPDFAKMIAYMRNKKQSQGAMDLNTDQITDLLHFVDRHKTEYNTLQGVRKAFKQQLPTNISSGVSISNYISGTVLMLGFTQDEYKKKLFDFLMKDVHSDEIADYRAFSKSIISIIPKDGFFELSDSQIERVMQAGCQ